MDISTSTSLFVRGADDDPTFDQAMDMLAAAGFSLIELSRKHRDVENYRRPIERTGLTVWAVHGILSKDAVADEESTRRKTLDAERARMEAVADFAPCPYVVHYHNRHLDPRVADTWKRSIDHLLPTVETLNLTLAIETVPYKPQVDARYANSAEVVEFVRSFDHPNVKVCIDLNHSNLKEDLVNVAHRCRNLIANIHVSDNTGDRENHLPPGQGIIDFHAALQAIVDAGYAGPLNLETHAEKRPTVATLSALRKNAETLVAALNV